MIAACRNTSKASPVRLPILPHRFALAVAASTLALHGTAGAQADALARAAAEKGAVVTDSGLVYRSVKDGSGAGPQATDTVRVHYRGTFPDGREFDSSYSRGQPASFPLNRVIKCWTEGLQRMKVGGQAKLTCPAAIAYGERGAGGVIPPNAVLQFDVELLGIEGK
jgi:FKBP-type peptidyl-prolyl cis-trans isomerase FkpA